MPDQEAVKAAAEAISRELNSGDIYQTHIEHDEHLARIALEAAAPVILAALAASKITVTRPAISNLTEGIEMVRWRDVERVLRGEP